MTKIKIGDFEVAKAIQWQDLQIEIESLVAASNGEMNQDKDSE